jgi:hypothetical protein
LQAASWRLKAEAYATKLPDELKNILNSHIPAMVQECVDMVHARVISLNAVSASELLGPRMDSDDACATDAAAEEEPAPILAGQSQRTVCVESHPEAGTPAATRADMTWDDAPMTCDEALPAATAPAGTQGISTGEHDMSLNPVHTRNASQVAVPLAPLPNGSPRAPSSTGAGQENGMQHLPHAQGAAAQDDASQHDTPLCMKRESNEQWMDGSQGDGKRRRLGHASQLSEDVSARANGNVPDVVPASCRPLSDVDGATESPEPEKEQQSGSDVAAEQTGNEESTRGGTSDLMKRLAMLPKGGHGDIDF